MCLLNHAFDYRSEKVPKPHPCGCSIGAPLSAKGLRMLLSPFASRDCKLPCRSRSIPLGVHEQLNLQIAQENG